MRIVSIGEILWDVFPDGEHLGGAPFNFAVNAHQLGHDVRFVSAVGDDERGRRAIEQVRTLGMDTRWIAVVSDAPTGFVAVEFDAHGEPRYAIHRPAAYDFEQASAELARDAGWIYFGTLLQTNPAARAAVRQMLDESSARRFYDVNLRPDSYSLDLVEALLDQANVVKMNDEEYRVLAAVARDRKFDAFCITRGKGGCSIWMGDDYVESPGYVVSGGDPVGAGNAFAAAFLHGLDAGWPVGEIAAFANRKGAEAAGRSGALAG